MAGKSEGANKHGRINNGWRCDGCSFFFFRFFPAIFGGLLVLTLPLFRLDAFDIRIDICTYARKYSQRSGEK